MSSEERQRVRIQLLEDVNKAEAEFFDAREVEDVQRRKHYECKRRLAETREILVAAQEKLRGFLLDPSDQ